MMIFSISLANVLGGFYVWVNHDAIYWQNDMELDSSLDAGGLFCGSSSYVSISSNIHTAISMEAVADGVYCWVDVMIRYD